MINVLLVFMLLSLFGGIFSLRSKGINPYGMGVIFLGIFILSQYLKLKGTSNKELIKLLTWVAVFGFLVVDIIIIINRFF